MVYVFLADGFETIEALAVVDMLRRAKIEVSTVGVSGKKILSAQNIEVTADITIDELCLDDASAVVLPGGIPGTPNLEAAAAVQGAIDYALANDKYICAICAAPSILGHRGILKGVEAISYPSYIDHLEGAVISDKYVVTDGKIITARGAGVAVDFGLEIVRALSDAATADAIRNAIQCQ